jgi:hypothetical protein
MSNPTPTGFLVGAMWKKALEQDYVYLVIYEEQHTPFIESAQHLEQEDSSVPECGILVFVSLQDASIYREFITEVHDDIRPSDLAVTKVKINDLWGLIEEFDVISQEIHGAPVRIELAQQLSDDFLLTDTLYSSLQLPN